MPRSRYRIFETEYPYFFTCTIVGWQPVFTRSETVNILFDSWRHLIQNDSFQLYGYVILENHIHGVALAPDLANCIKRFKMYTARKIIDLLKEWNIEKMLNQLRLYKRDHKTESDFQFWEEGCHPQQIANDDMMRQKLEYIHNNPVKRGYVDSPEHWRYSSARNYLGLPGLMDVTTDWM